MPITGTRNGFNKSLLALGFSLSLALTPALTFAETTLMAQNTPNPNTVPQNSVVIKQESVADLIRALKADLLEAQKQAYEKEMELNKLRGQLKEQQAGGEGSKTPWVQVNISGQTGVGAEQPAVSTPESLKTSLQYYKHQYYIKPGDKLMVTYIGEDPTRSSVREVAMKDIDGSALFHITVLTDGTIVVPPMGLVMAGGKTLKDLNEELRAKLKEYYRFADVSVSLAEAAPDDILVLGKVKKQGYLKVPVGTTLVQLFKELGGVEETADLSHVFIRKKDDGNVYMANMLAFLENGDLGQDMIMQSGDVVVIPEGNMLISYDKLANSPFLSEEFEVRVLGAAEKNAVIEVKPGDDLVTAISKAGGLMPHAKNAKIVLVREDESTNTLKTMTFKLKDLLDIETSKEYNIALRPNDLIVVNDSKFQRMTHTLVTQSFPTIGTIVAGQGVLRKFILGQ